MTIGVVIAAAGRGTRLKAARPKALFLLAGETLLGRSMRVFLGHPGVVALVAAVGDPAGCADALGAPDRRVRLVAGGADRQASVRAGLAALVETDLILVHDAARPLVGAALIDAVAAAALRHGAAVPCLPVSDTVKRVSAAGLVEGTVPRESLALAQTPQGFRADLLRRAHAEAARLAIAATDDAALVERLGHPVAVVAGSRRNLKITTPWDVRLAEALLAAGEGTGDEVGEAATDA